MAVEHDQIRRIRNRQHEAPDIGDERADLEIGQGLGACRARKGIHGRRQYDGRGVVRKKRPSQQFTM
jgi:hypothetical protein